MHMRLAFSRNAVICPHVFPLGAAACSYFSILIYIPDTSSPRHPALLLEVCRTQPETRSEKCSSPASGGARPPAADRSRLRLRRGTARFPLCAPTRNPYPPPKPPSHTP